MRRPTLPLLIPCLNVPGDHGDLSEVAPGIVDPRAGRAAFDFLAMATDLALDGRIDAITTLPLNKQALHQAGVGHPGHTEILAERCGVVDHAMMLYLETNDSLGSETDSRKKRRGSGLGVVHVTLHVVLRQVFALVNRESVLLKSAWPTRRCDP